jgi:hypothetical protein
MGRLPARLAIAGAALLLAAPAVAYVCHPDPAGTRSLSVTGHVVAYRLEGTTVTLALRSQSGCQVLVWRASAARPQPSSAACSSATPHRSAASGARLVAAAGADAPDRLQVFGSNGRIVHSWPLPVSVHPETLQVSGGLAAYRARSGIWVTALTSGRTTMVAPVRQGDRPLLNIHGLAYQDNTLKAAPRNRTVLKFVPTHAVRWELTQTGRGFRTGGPVRALSVDGTQAAFAVGGANGCDRVMFWSIPWRSVFQVSQKAGPTCAPGSPSGRISALALAGNRAEWVTTHRGRPMLVAADGIGCQEWVIRRLSELGPRTALAALAGDGQTLAFSVVSRSSRGSATTVGRVTGPYRGRDLARLPGVVRAVSADRGQIGALTTGGTITLNSIQGFHRRLDVPGATSFAVRRNLVVATTRQGRLEVVSLPTGRRLHSWAIPAGASHVDVQYGIAVVTAGSSVYGVDVASGRTARLAVAHGLVGAQVEPIGVVYATTTAKRGMIRLIPMSRVETAVR